MTDPMSLHLSPSGLFSKRGWADERDAWPEPLSPGEALGPAGDLAFARWVHDQAKELAGQLDRLARADRSSALSHQAAAIAQALRRDAEWARRRIDGSYAEAAE